MLAFSPEGFFLIHCHHLCFCFSGNRNALEPLDFMGIKQQFFLTHVIKNSHLLIAHHDQFLFFIRMKPGDKNVGFDTAGKIQGS